ncbi:hypothetical protein V6Z11_D05G404100 [Gossypium hirsutum]
MPAKEDKKGQQRKTPKNEILCIFFLDFGLYKSPMVIVPGGILMFFGDFKGKNRLYLRGIFLFFAMKTKDFLSILTDSIQEPFENIYTIRGSNTKSENQI